MKPPKPYIQAGDVYFADNGMRICLQCAGQSAKFTGRDLSGQRIQKATPTDAEEWKAAMAEPLACECGKTTL